MGSRLSRQGIRLVTAPTFAQTRPSWAEAVCKCGRDIVPAGATCWSCVDPDNIVDDGERIPGVRFDALGRRMSTDWLRGCAQAREARMIVESQHG